MGHINGVIFHLQTIMTSLAESLFLGHSHPRVLAMTRETLVGPNLFSGLCKSRLAKPINGVSISRPIVAG
jgi:hypothetical protein